MARAAAFDHQILRPSKSVDEKAIWVTCGPRRRSGSEESEAARGRFSGASVDRISGFSSREAEEHVCCVGFDRQRLDVHKSDRERHGLLGLEDLDTVVSHGSYEMLWSLDPTDKYV